VVQVRAVSQAVSPSLDSVRIRDLTVSSRGVTQTGRSAPSAGSATPAGVRLEDAVSVVEAALAPAGVAAVVVGRVAWNADGASAWRKWNVFRKPSAGVGSGRPIGGHVSVQKSAAPVGVSGRIGMVDGRVAPGVTVKIVWGVTSMVVSVMLRGTGVIPGAGA
jgi:hypothetical protein